MSSPPPFRRPIRLGDGPNTVDARGRIEIRCALIEAGNRPIKGNIIRSVVVADATVSEVLAAVRLHLLGEKPND